MRALLCNRVPVRKQELLSAIPMRALVCDRIPVQKQVRLHARNAPKVRNNTIPLRALEANLCVPFYNAENEKFVFCRFANWKKTSPRQCAHSNQSDQNGSFWQIAHMGTLKKCAYGYHNARIKVVRIWFITYKPPAVCILKNLKTGWQSNKRQTQKRVYLTYFPKI